MLTQERKEELKKEAETIWLQLMEETNGNAENSPAEPLQCSEQGNLRRTSQQRNQDCFLQQNQIVL